MLVLPAIHATQEPKNASETLQAIKQDKHKIEEKFSQAYDKAKTDEQRNNLFQARRNETQACVRRALEIAQSHPKDPAAFDALEWIVTGGLGYFPETWTALDIIQRDHITSKKLGLICRHARIYLVSYAGTEKLLRTVLEKNPDKNVQGLACFTLAEVLRDYASLAEGLKDPAKAKSWEQGLPVALVKKLKASDKQELLKEAEALYQRTLEKYGDVKASSGDQSLRQRVEAVLFELRFLDVGKVAPEIEGEDIDGKKFKLSDYRGKVLLLDFWGHW